MKLIAFNKQTLPAIRTKGDERPLLTINATSGVIRFNKAAIKKYKLKAGGSVSFFQDGDKPRNWYMCINPEAAGFVFQAKDKNAMSFGHRDLARSILGSIKASGTTEIPIGEKHADTGYYELITAAAAPSVTSVRLTRKKAAN